MKRPHVALIIEFSRGYARGLISGIAQYSRHHGPWSIYCSERLMSDKPPAWLDNWRGDGIIARIESPELEQKIIDKGLPAVDLRGKMDLDFPLIETDDKLVAELAATHLIDRGFRHFAYCGFPGANYSEVRQKYFIPALAREGFKCDIYPPPGTQAKESQQEQEMHGILYEEDVAKWLASLEKPVGILACNDIRAQQILNACREIDGAVPEEIAVLGVDNDDVICELSDPPLSSVEPDTWRIGFEAARKLDEMMKGAPCEHEKVFVEPKGVITRQSTDVMAIDDSAVATAVRYIRENACYGINVEDVIDHIQVSRTVLDRRFKSALGRTPKQEISRIRLNRVKQLLKETDYPMSTICDLTGYKHQEYLNQSFKKIFGETPGQFRKRYAFE